MNRDTTTIRARVIQELSGELTCFLDSPLRNTYISDNDGIANVYIRKGLHCIDGIVEHCLDIAAISILPEFQGHGIGSGVINMMHANNPYGTTFVESLLNDTLYTHLINCGWKDVQGSTPPSVFLETIHERTMRPLRSND